METVDQKDNNRSASIWLLLGLLTVALALYGVLCNKTTLATVSGFLAAGFGLVLAFRISQIQDSQSQHLTEIVETSHGLLRQLAERDSEQDYGSVERDPEQDCGSVDGESPAGGNPNEPSYAGEALSLIQAREGNVPGNATWRRKTPNPQRPGNHGWFVEFDEDPKGRRWFTHRARGLSVRRAMPREFLDALENDENLDPKTIALDFQTKEHGLGAWYARTYDGDLYKVSRSNRNKSKGINVEKLEGDECGSDLIL